MSLLISNAVAAQAGQAASSSGAFGSLFMIAGFILIFYFLLVRPQNKRAKEQKELITHLNKGDEVITSGGILGKITQISEQFVVLAIAEGVEVKSQKSAIATALPKGTIKSI